ncbi:GTP cyclohydrolase I [Streptomyces sp. NPDC056161]|uniref:GTP cyclohydrolase I n=1 Tax=Streptomyces sp. NPDC056161 TaxID=3345732 RepID=UPI0035D63FF1
MTTITPLEPRPEGPSEPEHGGAPDEQTAPDLTQAARHARAMFACLGIPCADEHTVHAPERFVHAVADLTAGHRRDPLRSLDVTFPAESADPGMIVVSGVRFVSLCRHHLLPWAGTATVAYLPAPGARIVGLSKLARLVEGLAARPQTQERLGQQIVHAIDSRLDTLGAACVIRASHACGNPHGTPAPAAHTATTHLLGVCHDDPAVRAELLALATPPSR